MVDSSTKSRIQARNSYRGDGKCVVYVMSRDQRVADNHALLAAQQEAIEKQLPFAVVFVLRPESGYRAREHYIWMLGGLKEIEQTLAQLNIPLLVLIGDPFERLQACLVHLQPRSLYFDYNPLKRPRRIVQQMAQLGKCAVYEVDTHNIVPVWQASDKQENGARTLRPKLLRQLDTYLIEPAGVQAHPVAWTGPVLTIRDLQEPIHRLIQQVPKCGQDTLMTLYPPGAAAAEAALATFLRERLQTYHVDRNDPTKNGQSELSPYIHFGQISSLRIVMEATRQAESRPGLKEGLNVLIEELVVRKELSDNFCMYADDYRSINSAPAWAQTTLAKHRTDLREHLYSYDVFVRGQTHDTAWNAAQRQLLRTGKIHGYMRMYWAKKVLEWSESPEAALEILIKLNDTYSLDGGDPNGYVGILWSVAGLHDRPWKERAVYGTVRSMVYSGLRRKFDIAAYEQEWSGG